ncbi:NAD(P)H-dependent glycerol-3-phosphate dehydrogenase [Ferribacterium limneticum]|uniref:NAD(P)H-dependent glycerol-3-phosphate dehydrogenase n=1 Tax=Ferribacterium limneticum TaxID=76259 RepID=UPI001CF9DFEB|nr:NAD(P)H-dependent glycerol-3-phosphate dehydrogenase [Ferribacterium limneticum]UCV29150.1 NAD(P)-dependent glycerol-3-phosphate dehydrogenase [Ferribacterium limneticum]UCV33069.1 NAD(P)-dependent glycerol-3-phosphate dehydrogenase [Ferribacterium limneticum]
MKITLLGAGAWGTALSIAFSGKHDLTLWSREADVADDLLKTRENRRFFPGYKLPESVAVSTDFEAAVADAELLVVATPIAGLRPTVERLKALGCKLPVLWVCKGFEAGSGKLPHQVVAEVLGKEALCGALSGPSFAEEVAAGQPTAVSLAANEPAFAREAARQLHSTRLRIYANDDLVGVEVGGAVKNVLAIATGVCDGLGLGLNSRAALMTRGLAEIARLGLALGAERQTFMGLAGMGDLILTCTGDLSRNRRVGLALAQDKSLPQILEELGHVAEGVYTAREVDRLAAKLGVEMPISAAVAAVLDGRLTAAQAVEQLMARDPKEELA